MFSTKRNLYLLLGFACLGGYAWVMFHLYQQHSQQQAHAFGMCLFKQTTSIPCPACGTTRSVLALSNGNINTALQLNPIGFIIVIALLVLPFWLAYDVLTKRDSLYFFYRKTEAIIRQPKWAIPLSLLVILNWVWNIYKDV
jgi:hypothetical protein